MHDTGRYRVTELLDALLTERGDARYSGLDDLDTLSIARLMNSADAAVAGAVAEALPALAAAVDAVAARMERGGRLRYVGAGTAGRLAVLDAAECPPTFGTDRDLVRGVLAGAPASLTGPTEGTEDSTETGAADLLAAGLGPLDSVIGVTASGRTPYVLGAVDAATAAGALTVGVSCNPGAALSARVQHPIEVPVGPEVLTGSTRLKAGTAQKLVLNTISTITMIRLGRTYRNHMVDVRVLNHKLLHRATRMVAELTDADLDTARQALDAAGRHVKTAVLMIERGLDAPTARALLDAHRGRLAAALTAANP
jgi:N-acetylmuramic acid 6-phosphate etherase